MANTVIQLKHSTLTGNVPSSLANGEISINNHDGKFFYSTPAGVVTTHYPYLGPAGLNKEIQFNDSGTLGSNSGLAFDKTSGSLNVSTSLNVSGRDLGAYVNSAFTTANTPSHVANSASSYANAAFSTANNASGSSSAGPYANAAFDTANSAASYANAAFATANSASGAAAASSYANSAFTTANSSASYANAAFDRANAAYTQANTGGGGTLTGYVDAFTANGATPNFTLSTTPSNKNITFVAVQGVLQPKVSYNISGTILTFDSTPPNTAYIEVTTLSGSSMTWYIANANTTMVASSGYFVDTTTGPKTLTLPESATLGDTIRINDLAGTFNANNLTVGANGGKIQGANDDLLINVNQQSFGLVYSNSTYGWKVIEL